MAEEPAEYNSGQANGNKSFIIFGLLEWVLLDSGAGRRGGERGQEEAQGFSSPQNRLSQAHQESSDYEASSNKTGTIIQFQPKFITDNPNQIPNYLYFDVQNSKYQLKKKMRIQYEIDDQQVSVDVTVDKGFSVNDERRMSLAPQHHSM